MSTIDLTAFQTEATDTVVTMPDGSTIKLRPLMQLGPEHDDALLELIEAVSALAPDDAEASVPMDKVTRLMPAAAKILAAAAPSKTAAEKLARLPLPARMQLVLGYIEDQDLGGLTPSVA